MRSDRDNMREYCKQAISRAKELFRTHPCKETLANYRYTVHVKKLMLQAFDSIEDAKYYLKFIHKYIPNESYNTMMYAASVAKSIIEENKGGDKK